MRVTIEFDGLTKAIDHMSSISEKAPEAIAKQVKELAEASKQAWQQATPKRTGRLQEGDVVQSEGMSFTLSNTTYYYDFVDRGHQTARGWHTKHGYRPAKRQSHVEGQEMTQKAVQFIEENIEEYISKFVDDL